MIYITGYTCHALKDHKHTHADNILFLASEGSPIPPTPSFCI